MLVTTYIVAKAVAWIGLVIGLLSATKPETTSRLIAAGFRLRRQTSDGGATVGPRRDLTKIQVWGVAAAGASAVLISILTFVVVLAYQME